MKTSLLEQVRQMETLGGAWRVVLENGRSSPSIDTRREIEEFATSAEKRLTKIQRQLNRNAFRFSPAKGVAARKKGKKGIRPLVVAPIDSRIVQRAIHDVLVKVPAIRQYAENPYSFGGVKKQVGQRLAAVPAAIQAVLAAIGDGATYVTRSDITSFFTKIQKPIVTGIVAGATCEPSFMELFGQAITVELENLASLREHASAFPIQEIGVAQGNSLSPLLGNLLLYDFDQQMNAGECRTIRYIDDFLILAPSRRLAERQFFEGREHLKKLGLEVSTEKTSKAYVADGFEFLGIEMGNGLIRPNRKSRNRLLASVSAAFNKSVFAFQSYRKAGTIFRSFTLIRTLSEVSGIVSGWGAHYSFCNDKNVFRQLDCEIDTLLRQYLGAYSAALKSVDQRGRRRLLGLHLLEELAHKCFDWPKPTHISHASSKPALPSTFVASG